MSRAKATTDQDVIKQWVGERGGCPARVKGSASSGNAGILRIDYTGFSGQQSLEKISWKAFFDAFEKNSLAFLFQDEKDSRFSKLVSRENADLENATKAGAGSRAKGTNGAQKSNGAKKANGAKSSVDAIELLKQQ